MIVNEELRLFLEEIKEEIEKQMPSHIERLSTPSTLKEAMVYSLKAGGKRVRPALLLATLKSFGKPVQLGYEMACAIEMIHTYSLVHDDLPAMDNDDIRRGKPTNHKVYGEAMAILAGDALLTYSFELVSMIAHNDITPEQKVSLISELAKASGPEGMVGGQVADIEGENQSLTLDHLVYIHTHKTGDLLTAAITCGAILANATPQEINDLRSFAFELGLMFQIKDDILDVEGDSIKIGKLTGSDDENNKSTYPNLLGLDGAKAKLHEHKDKAKDFLAKVNIDQTLLLALTDYIVERDH
ncbi:polyprenyl synthetase family protein [Halalkalibacter krulwichiae]|uniref:Farnesyl diphosphate synthase n=1 Tax=Halalkalibacter krulwichiae TaxID=199441 RepID=A0A1X9MIC8_9BACI|nr:farnesyl diphosphate synthase [Halalkalibacter krulwichiae]ARK31391.1 Farnesyl diphosphate synthase [Halalkalibacter krulwichiae]